MGEIRVHIKAHLDVGDGPRELVADVRIEYVAPLFGGDIDVFTDLSELAVDDVTTDVAGDVPKLMSEGSNRRRYTGSVSISGLPVAEPALGEDDPHRRALHRAGLTDEQIDRSVFSPEVLEMVTVHLSKDTTLQVLLERRLAGRVNSVVGKKFNEITEAVRVQEREAAEQRVAEARDVAYGRAREDLADEVRREVRDELIPVLVEEAKTTDLISSMAMQLAADELSESGDDSVGDASVSVYG